MEYKGRGKIDWRSLAPPDPSTGYSPRNLGDRPAYGFYIRHARNVVLENVSVSLEEADSRPAIFAFDVAGLRLDGFRADRVEDFDVYLNEVTEFSKTDGPDIIEQRN